MKTWTEICVFEINAIDVVLQKTSENVADISVTLGAVKLRDEIKNK